MAEPEQYDAVVVGSGEGGKYLAWHAAQGGQHIAVVERRWIGGSCPNINCLPSKNDHGPQLASRENPDVYAEIRNIMELEGIEVVLSAETEQVDGRSGGRVVLRVRTPAGERTIEGTHLLVAAGRTPNTRGIGLEANGIGLDDGGYIRVNDRLETTAADTWAIGECAGSPQFTHVSLDEFRVIRDRLGGGRRATTGRLVPYCMLIDPPLARVGMSERDAKAKDIPVRAAKLAMESVRRTRTTSETTGFMKALVGADDRIVGFTMIGSGAGEVMAAVQRSRCSRVGPTPQFESLIRPWPRASTHCSEMCGKAGEDTHTRAHTGVAGRGEARERAGTFTFWPA